MRIEVTALIEAPWTEVFTAVADVRGWSARIPAIESVEVLTPGPIRVGTRFRETRRLHGRVTSEEMSVVELEVPSRFVLTAANHGVRYRAEHIITDEGNRSARLMLIFSGEPVTLAARLFAPFGWLTAGSVRRMLESDLAALKAACEGR